MVTTSKFSEGYSIRRVHVPPVIFQRELFLLPDYFHLQDGGRMVTTNWGFSGQRDVRAKPR